MGRVASGREERREDAEEQMSPRAAGPNTLRGGRQSIEAHPGASKGSVEKALQMVSYFVTQNGILYAQAKLICCMFSSKAVYEVK